MDELTEQEAEGLNSIKARMSNTQRQEMAEIIRQEMVRRGMIEPGMEMDGTERKETQGKETQRKEIQGKEAERKDMSKKSTVRSSTINGGMSTDQVQELYQDVGQAVQKLRVKKLEEKLDKARGRTARAPRAANIAAPAIRVPKSSNVAKHLLMYAVCGLGLLKAASVTGLLDSTLATGATGISNIVSHLESEKVATARVEKVRDAAPAKPMSGNVYTPSEKELLTQLDARRVELEHRKDALDRRDQELKNQAQVITERLAELRGLTAKLSELRKERENKQEGRLAQLANVYGAMEPGEAANLISRLDDSIALELLERMPEKRMGQVLSFMEKGRAVDLTKMLTEKKVTS